MNSGHYDRGGAVKNWKSILKDHFPGVKIKKTGHASATVENRDVNFLFDPMSNEGEGIIGVDFAFSKTSGQKSGFLEQSENVRPDSIAFARRLKAFAQEAKENSYGIYAEGADEARQQTYEKILSRIGFEKKAKNIYFDEGGTIPPSAARSPLEILPGQDLAPYGEEYDEYRDFLERKHHALHETPLQVQEMKKQYERQFLPNGYAGGGSIEDSSGARSPLEILPGQDLAPYGEEYDEYRDFLERKHHALHETPLQVQEMKKQYERQFLPNGYAGGGSIEDSSGFVPVAPGIPSDADEVPIQATAGEFVVKKSAAQIPENRFVLEAINRGEHFDKGGEIGKPWFRSITDLLGLTKSSGSQLATESTQQQILQTLKGSLNVDVRYQNKSQTRHEVDQLLPKPEPISNRLPVAADRLPVAPDRLPVAPVDDFNHPGRPPVNDRHSFRPGLPPPEVKKEEKTPSLKEEPSHSNTMNDVISGLNDSAPEISAAVPEISAAVPEISAAVPEISAVVPEISAVVVAYKAVVDALNFIPTAGTRALGSIAAGAANPDANVGGVFRGVGDQLSSFGDKVIYVNPLLGIMANTAGEAAKQLGIFHDAVMATSVRYGEFSPEISSAQAIAEIKQTMGDFRRSQEIGPELSRYIEMQSNLQQKFEDIKIQILMKILPIVTVIGEVAEQILPSGENVAASLNLIALSIQAMNPLATVLANMAQIMKDANRPPVDDPTSILFQDASVDRDPATRKGVGVPSL